MSSFCFVSFFYIIERPGREILISTNFQIPITSFRRDKRNTSGFSILEVLLLLIVVGVMVSGILPLFVTATRANKSAAYYSIAYRKIDSQIETYRRASFDGLTSGTFTVTGLPSGQGNVVISNVIDGAPQADIKRADLTITWFLKKNQQVKASTYITRNGVGR